MILNRTDQGFASIAVLLAVATFTVFTVLAGGVRWAMDYRVVQAAADLAAIAGANARLEGALDPCSDAAEIASANASHLESCDVVGEAVRVSISKPSVWRQLHAESVAGPDLATSEY
jgi:secretion/DNA translocation related TadE-like protein